MKKAKFIASPCFWYQNNTDSVNNSSDYVNLLANDIDIYILSNLKVCGQPIYSILELKCVDGFTMALIFLV